MGSIGNHKPFSAMHFLLMLLVSFPVIAGKPTVEEKNNSSQQNQWDMDFFTLNCPGGSLTQTLPVSTGSKVDVTADNYNAAIKGMISFQGNVKLHHQQKTLSSDEALLNQGDNTFNAHGNVRYQDQQIRLTADVIDLDFAHQTGRVNNTKFQLGRGTLRGEAKTISLHNGQKLSIREVGITSCPPGSESWLLASSKIEIFNDIGWGQAENVVLRINDVPVFYLPSFSFPVDDRRKSGFLYPSIGSSSRNGFEIETPWYWNIASDKDATFSTRYLSNRGLMLAAEYRQLTEHSENEFYVEYLPNDDRGLPEEEERFFYQLSSNYSSGEHWRGQLNLSSVSDDDYFFDFGANYKSSNRDYLQRLAQVSFNSEHLSFSALLSNDLLLSTPADPYQRLPQLRLSVLYPDGLAGLTANLHLAATAFRRANAVEAERMTIIPDLSLPIHWLSGYIKPRLKLHYSRYSQDDPTNTLPETVSRSVPIFSIDSAMIFERPVDFSEQNFVQTLEPRIFYLYVPERRQNDIALFDTTSVNNGVDSLFRENRYSGDDRIGDSNQLSLAITSRFYEQDSGRERLRLTMGRAYYLEDRWVNLAIYQNGSPVVDLGVDKRKSSALITNLQLELDDSWRLKGELEYDESQSRTEKGVLDLQYLSSGLVINLQHRLNRFENNDDIEQAEISFSWQFTDDIAFVGRWQQDIRKNRTIDSFAGLEYESCCWALRLVARRYLNVRLDQQGISVPGEDEFNNGIYLEFILKGLTNVGNGLRLEREIQGYEDRFKNY